MELLNYAFIHKRFPDEMKNAEIAPIFKKKDYMNKENYRPISILTVFSKVFESIKPNSSWNISKTFLMICCVPIEKSMDVSIY